MKKNKLFIIGIAVLAILFSSCKDELADINTNPGDITEPDIRYLFTTALTEMKPMDYRQWFYDFRYMLQWGQVTAPSGGNGDRMNEQAIADGIGGTVYRVMLATREIQHLVDNEMEGEAQASYQYIRAMTYPIMAYLAILDSDMYGSMAYSEAFKARYTDPPLLTPKHDTQEELFDILLRELEETINTLTNPVTFEGRDITQVSLGKQDLIYDGDVAKWAKFANSLRLKIAVRLLHADKEKAFSIAQDVMNSSAGILSGLNDDFVYNAGSKFYHFNDQVSPGTITKHLTEFMIENRDPRIRFFFNKNSFNSRVVQAYFDAQAANPNSPNVPSYILEQVNYSEVDGKKVFESWKAPGEPWVRYHGVPAQINDNLKSEYREYFDPQGNLFKITLNGQERTYNPLSSFNHEMLKGNLNYTFPDAPGAPVVEDIEPHAWYGLYFSTAEVYLYLTELRLLGANIAIDPATYFEDAVRLSVQAYDRMAGLNQIPYYSAPYDTEHGKAIKLENGEVEQLVSQPAYQLTGDRATDLEKVYIQQHIHFTHLPADMFSSMRRSGVPTYDSEILPFLPFADNYVLPRRFNVNEPLESDKMYDIVLESYRQQGYTMSTTDVNRLNSERVWYDKEAPEFGQGPNL